MRAPCLPQGGVIGICSPSHVAGRGRYARIEAGIRALGFQVREADNLYRDTYGYLATPEERAADFHQLLYDDEVRLIFFGGGEGSNELLPLLDFDAIRRHPKRMASFSDGTTLLTIVSQQPAVIEIAVFEPDAMASELKRIEDSVFAEI